MARMKGMAGLGLVAATLVAAAGAWADTPAAGTPAATPAPAAAPAAAAPAATGPTISGFVNGTYSYDFRSPAGQTTMLRSYDAKANSFRLDDAHIAIGGGLGDVNYVIETDAGVVGMVDSAADLSRGPTFIDLQEAYVTFKDPIAKSMGVDVLVKAGKFVTTEGIEVIESGNNPTISRGYLFGIIEPFTHTGLLMTWTKGFLTLSGGIANGMDLLQDMNTPKTALWLVGVNLGDKIGTVTFNGCTGAEQAVSPGYSGRMMDSNDMTAVFKFVPKTDLNVQVNYRDEQQPLGGVNKQGGAGIQPLIHFTDAVSLGLRLEYYELKAAGLAYGMGSIAATNETATLAWGFAKNCTLRYEVRHDDAGTPTFEDSFGHFRKSTLTLGTEFIVTF